MCVNQICEYKDRKDVLINFVGANIHDGHMRIFLRQRVIECEVRGLGFICRNIHQCIKLRYHSQLSPKT